MTPRLRYFLTAFLLALLLDQGTKQSIAATLAYGERVVVIPELFHLFHVRNPGGAFSFMADAPWAQRMFLHVGVATLGIGMVFVFYRRLEPEQRRGPLALGMVLGGAVGNLFDRLAYGGVVDWIDVFLWGGYSWPTFNVADSAIVVGAVVLLWDSFTPVDEAPEPDARPSPTSGGSPPPT